MAPRFQKILVAVDFSPASKAAVEHALTLAERFQGTVHLLHTWEVPVVFRPDLTVWAGEAHAPLEEFAHRESQRYMQEFVDEMKLGGRADVTTEVGPGTAAHAILTKAEKDGFDLIVMGTHGRTGLSHFVLGSVAEKVVRQAKCAVLTVRPPAAA